MTPEEYYNDSSQHGNYQYTTLDEVINNFMMSRDADDYTATVPRYKVLYQAKRGLRELYYDVVKEIKAIELDISPTLNIILPPDFVNYVRVSWVDTSGQLHPMAVNTMTSMAQVYLQSNDYELLFSSDGEILVGDSNKTPTETEMTNCNRFSFINKSFNPNKNYSKVFGNGSVVLNKSEGLLQFSSDVQGQSVVLEYISDGLYNGTEGQDDTLIKIHKFAENALVDYIHYSLIKNRRNVPFNEKQRARREYYNSHRISKRRISSLRKDDLLQTFKGANRWIKS